jgi:hypothetical protein
MNNLLNNLTTTLTSTINSNSSGGSGGGSSNSITLHDIPKEELINLLMKMQKRMQLLETKGNMIKLMMMMIML